MSKHNCSICGGSIHELRVEVLRGFGMPDKEMTCIECAGKNQQKRKGLVLGGDSSDFRIATKITDGARLFDDRESESGMGVNND